MMSCLDFLFCGQRLPIAASTVLLSVVLSAAAPAAGKFETRLLPAPVSDLTAAFTTGDGDASAVLDGDKLTVNGTFSGLTASATDAHLFLGSGIGVPGASILDLVVSQATSGSISGTFTLTRPQVAALKSGHFYIQINSMKAGPPYGNLWGWLLPEHETEAQDLPQEGHWFQPQYDVPQRP